MLFRHPVADPSARPGHHALSSQSTCVVNTLAKPAEGTLNLDTGDAELQVSLSSATYLTGPLTAADPVNEPLCPKCVNGKCGTGARKGLDCATTNPDGYTRDCPPPDCTFLGTIGVVPVAAADGGNDSYHHGRRVLPRAGDKSWEPHA